jgi:hypothetical protein
LALPHLLTVQVCEPADGVVEVAAVFRRAGQVHAVAFRLEGLDRRWQITVVELADNPVSTPPIPWMNHRPFHHPGLINCADGSYLP